MESEKFTEIYSCSPLEGIGVEDGRLAVVLQNVPAVRIMSKTSYLAEIQRIGSSRCVRPGDFAANESLYRIMNRKNSICASSSFVYL